MPAGYGGLQLSGQAGDGKRQGVAVDGRLQTTDEKPVTERAEALMHAMLTKAE